MSKDYLGELGNRLDRMLARLEAEEEAGRITDPVELERIKKQKRRARARDQRIQKTYGMSAVDYRAMYDIQHGRCAACETPHDQLAIDHCHDTQRIRGLLCNRCNVALGLIREDIKAARGLTVYIERRCIPSKEAGQLDRMV